MNKTKERVKDIDLGKYTTEAYTEYAVSVLEDRAIPDFRDGMIPVARRVLWASHNLRIHSTSKPVKAARIVGDTLGRFHPHGDTSCFSAMVKMTNGNVPIPLFEGEGNWGSLSDPSYAAMRYVEARLSKFSDTVLFNKFYTPVMETCPNYDGQETEPVVLPALLPILFLNGKFGIAPGAQTNIPAFSFKTVVKLLKLVYGGAPLTAKLMFKVLRAVSVYGGVERKPDGESRKLRMNIFRSCMGKTVLWSNPKYDASKKVITVTRFASEKMEKMLLALLKLPGVAEARDDSSKGEKYGTINVVPKRGMSEKDIQALVERVDNTLSSTENFILNFTERYLDEEGQAKAKLKAMSLLQAFSEWVTWRTALEKRACGYWIGEASKHIRRVELLILAVDNRKLIIESLDKDLDQDKLEQWLAAKLKISKDEAHFIYQLRVIQLRKLERVPLLEEKKSIESHKATLEKRQKKPEPFMVKQLDEFLALEKS